MSELKISPQLKSGQMPKQPPVGLGGWFTLIIIGLFAISLSGIVSIFELFSIGFEKADPLLLTFYFFCILNDVALSAFILVFIFKHNIIFRMLFIIQTCVITLCFFIYFYIALAFGFKSELNFISILGRILWTVYLFRSERVKNTFFGIKSINKILENSEELVKPKDFDFFTDK